MAGRVERFIKKEAMLSAAFLCAVISAVLVPPDAEYLSYMNFKVLAILFCLMAVVAGLRSCGVFGALEELVVARCRSTRALCLSLVMLPFFFSMLVTNDVALITFVPFTIYTLRAVGRERLCPWVIVLQTVAANLGSMATPIGNPQNLFLYSFYALTPGQFFGAVAPIAALGLVGLSLAALLTRGGALPEVRPMAGESGDKKPLWLYIPLLLLCLCSVFGAVDYRIVLLAVAAAMLIFSRRTLLKVDYCLLLTFVCFFIFSGNLGRLPVTRDALETLTGKSALLSSAAGSQIISNVPAAVLLSGFTENWKGLLLGVDVGGLGTPIASLASVISFKYYFAEPGARKGRFLWLFAAANLAGLIILLPVAELMLTQ